MTHQRRVRWLKLGLIAIAVWAITQLISGALPGSKEVLRATTALDALPPPKIHPLPASLAEWQDTSSVGDYFTNIQTTGVGFLVWSEFPVTVYVETSSSEANSASNQQFQQWVQAVQAAIGEWNAYLPLQPVASPETADIIIRRSPISRKIQLNPETGLYEIPRAITAQTSYEFYLKPTTAILSHKMTLKISPELSQTATLAAARHEIGHA
ncbi:MAG TPA: peptidase, partial [Xenococcaceae cyanobacterium]